ncbi:MFS transporter [Actinopolymorpha sp. B9G3]|uniref:MFS transporter n=1 Tax=Actinopolymorpha sp. B9G3 TaxID=3158970 RepID=UPI0032D91937
MLRQWNALARYPDFLKLFTADTISGWGSSISTVALPLTAVVVLDASPLQMGLLGAATFLPHLVLGLPAGVWVDRMPYRRVLVLADLARALLLACIPVLAVLGMLAMWHLYAVAMLAGVGTLFATLAAMSFVPLLVGRAHLLEANSATVQSASIVQTIGAATGGALVQLLTAPIAIAADAFSFLVAGLTTMWIRTPGVVASGAETSRPLAGEATRPNNPSKQRLWSLVGQGLRATVADPILRAIVLSATIGALAGQMQSVMLVLYLTRQLGLAPGVVGIAIAVSGGAAVLGAFVAGPVTGRLGHGPTFIAGGLIASTAGLVLATATGPLPLVLGIVLIGQVFAGGGPLLYAVNQRTIRQSLVAPEMLTRINATWRFLVFGAQPVGALLGGVAGGALGLRSTMVVASVGMLTGVAVAVMSPLRTLRTLPGASGT